ncbi:melibiose operon regulatory protein [Abditibacteriota bacterium]|nr:melibiose operon regulatory protein [Abditibacteriota bacterium]
MLIDEDNAAILGFSSGYRMPRLMHKAHRHQEIEINFLLAGTMTYLATGGIVRVPAGRLAVFWAAAPHQIIALEAVGHFYWFTIPFAWVVQWQLAESFINTLLQGGIVLDEVGNAGDEAVCARWHSDLQSGDMQCVRAAQLEMEARLIRLIHQMPHAQKSTKGSSLPDATDAVQKMAEFIARNYMRSLNVAEIAQPTGLHPNYAMTLFRSTCGMSVLDYLVQHRLFHARRLLLTSDLKIIDVALESGFGSLSRFYEAFTRANGCSPQRFRKQIHELKGQS